jgi:MoaA/NifB/PqqE/SkfB family radical SAM enzyme
MPFASFVGLIDALAELGKKPLPIVGFTGGEPFMYHYGRRTLSDLVRKVSELQPGRITIQTSGYGPGVKDFREQLTSCIRASGCIPIEISTSYTLYQRPGLIDRMKRTIRVLVEECVQETLFVYLTSNIGAFNETLRSFARLCGELGFADVELNNDLAQVRVETNRCSIVGLACGTAAVGRGAILAEKVKLRSDEIVPAEVGLCGYLGRNRPTMVVYPDGNAHVCCMPQATGNPSFIMNVFEEPPLVFFEKHQKLKELFVDLLESFSSKGIVVRSCDVCNALNHATLKVNDDNDYAQSRWVPASRSLSRLNSSVFKPPSTQSQR